MTKKQIAIALTAITLIYITMKIKSKIKPIAAAQKIRGCDLYGCGNFGAERKGHKHQGIDIVVKPNEAIFSPITGTVTRHPFPYSSDLSYTGIEIKNADYSVKIFYITPTVPIGTTVIAGDIIGKAQNIAKKYGAKMTNHAHLEIRDSKNVLLNPEQFYV